MTTISKTSKIAHQISCESPGGKPRTRISAVLSCNGHLPSGPPRGAAHPPTGALVAEGHASMFGIAQGCWRCFLLLLAKISLDGGSSTVPYWSGEILGFHSRASFSASAICGR
jgi:hypothetical protein